jgi:hypothetical protein
MPRGGRDGLSGGTSKEGGRWERVTTSDGPAAWLATGQALQRVLLRARAAQVWSSFLNEPVEVPELGPRLAETIGRQVDYPQLVVRLGYGPQVKPEPRRAVEEVLWTEEESQAGTSVWDARRRVDDGGVGAEAERRGHGVSGALPDVECGRQPLGPVAHRCPHSAAAAQLDHDRDALAGEADVRGASVSTFAPSGPRRTGSPTSICCSSGATRSTLWMS